MDARTRMIPATGIALRMGQVVVIGEREHSVAVLPVALLAIDDVVLTEEADDDERSDERDDAEDGDDEPEGDDEHEG